MAFKFPKLPGFGTVDAKSRVFFIFAAILAVCVLVYVLVKIFGGSLEAAGPSRVANPAANLQSVPGSKLTPEYYQALKQANLQATQQAQATGGSSVPTLVNVPGQEFGGGNCTVMCPGDEEANVANDLSGLVKEGKLSQEEADKLNALAKNNVSVDEYAAALDELVRQGKLTPEQARKLLEKYKLQHGNALLTDSAKSLDALIKSGQLPIAVANDLLALQKAHVSPADYAAQLDRLAKEGKISPALAAQLLAQYTQQQQKEKAKAGAFRLNQMAKKGEITQAVADELADLQDKNTSIDDYAAELQKLVAAGKLTPEAAARLLDQYKKQRAGLTATAGIDGMIAQKEAACDNEMNSLVKEGKLPAEVATVLTQLRQKNVPVEEYLKALDGLVKQQKLSAADSQKLGECYKGLFALREEAKRLKDLQLNNASASSYADELKRAVQAGLMTPEMAAKLLQEYQSAMSALTAGPVAQTNLPTVDDFAKLQQQLAQQQSGQFTPAVATGQSNDQFAAAEEAARAQAMQEREQRIQDMESAMSGQAQQLLTAWQPPSMQHKAGAPDEKKTGSLIPSLPGAANKASPNSNNPNSLAPAGPPLLKTGTIAFAVLDTGVNSDYPDTPVMATIVSGPMKGAKLLGKVQVGQGPGLNKVSLQFNLMDMEGWPTTKTINAFAIDPDTARTVMASHVDNHYFERYGAIMASSFLSGYASALTTAGSTATTGIFGTSTAYPSLSPAAKLAVGLGQIGTNLTSAAQSYMNRPLTVTVDAGVGLGILFMSDVAQ